MDKQRVRDILKAHACCSFANIENKLCMLCPWNDTEDCESTVINEEVIIKAMNTLKGIENMKKIKLSEIKITSAFENTTPNPEKVQRCREYYTENQKQSKPILLDYNNVLIDGYCMYLILMEHKEEYAEVKISHCMKKRWERKNVKDWVATRYRENPTTYIYGVHPNSKDTKTYMWRVPESWTGWVDNIQIGDTIMCATKNGYAPVVVNKIEVLDKCPIDIPVKKVCKKEIRRNGMVVEY